MRRGRVTTVFTQTASQVLESNWAARAPHGDHLSDYENRLLLSTVILARRIPSGVGV